MKILLTGGGSGGHFYPLIAVAEKINELISKDKLLPAELYYMSDSPHDSRLLLENKIQFVKVPAGKMRRYFSIMNIVDIFSTALGIITSFFSVFSIFPDVIFSKGAYASFPVLVAARFFRIPVIIHESDSTPGRTNKWAGKFAKRIALSYPDAASFFDEKKVAITGNPVRNAIKKLPQAEVAKNYFGINAGVPVILILGGSLGAKMINDVILQMLAELVEKYYVIHQIGKNNIQEIIATKDVILQNSQFKDRYIPLDYLDDLKMSMAAGASDLIISRAGSTIFEIANWGKPSILIPITDTNGDHQRKNAYYYARFNATTVIEENNLTTTILVSEIDRILNNKDLYKRMSDGALSFVKTDAAETIAREILQIALSHEK